MNAADGVHVLSKADVMRMYRWAERAFDIGRKTYEAAMRKSPDVLGHKWFLKVDERGKFVRTCSRCGSTIFSIRMPSALLKKDPGKDFVSPAGLKWNSPCLDVARMIHDM